MNVLAFLAHPEDAAFFCAGTLMKYRDRGDEIYIALSTGNEAPWGAEEMGAEVRLLGYERGNLIDCMDARADCLTAIRWANADVILTDAPWDGDSDHAVTGKLAMDSLLIVGGKLHPAHLPPIDKLPHLFYTDTIAGQSLQNRPYLNGLRTTDQTFSLTPGVHSNDLYEPEAYVNVDAYMEKKLAMLAPDEALQSGCSAQCRIRGIQMGCTYAEGFTGHRNIGHLADYRLLP